MTRIIHSSPTPGWPPSLLSRAVSISAALALLNSCSLEVAEEDDFSTQNQQVLFDGQYADEVGLTMTPLREFSQPGAVAIEQVRTTFPQAGTYDHTVYFYQPAASPTPIQITLQSQTQTGNIDYSSQFSQVHLVKSPGQSGETTETLFSGFGYQSYYTTAAPGWYALVFSYTASENRTLQFEIFGSGSRLPIQWVDPPDALDMQVRLTVRSAGQNHIFLKGGAYRDASIGAESFVSQVRLNQQLMYERGFSQGKFAFPLGLVLQGTYTVDFRLQADARPVKYWYGVNERSFDPSGVRTSWAPVQFLYQGSQHTADYDAWSDGVAFAQGSTPAPSSVRPPPVRRGTDFVVSIEHSSLENSHASLQVTPYSGGSNLGWSATRFADYEGGVWQGSSGRISKRRELWRVHVPADAKVGRYVLRARTSSGSTIGNVLFYVLFDPYDHVDNWALSKAELETYAYDEDDDGTDLTGPHGTDSDHFRDNFTATAPNDLYAYGGQDSKITGAFRRTRGARYSVLDNAAAVIDGTGTEFEAARRLYRLVAQRIDYNNPANRDNCETILLGSDSQTAFTPEQAAAFAQQGVDMGVPNRVSGECFDYADALTSIARSAGLVARSVSGNGLGDWGNHGLTEIFLGDLPHHGGGTVPYWTKNRSDVDPWYVFDATDPLGNENNNPPAEPFAHSSEAISPRSQYGYAHWVHTGQTSTALTPGVNWDPFATVAPAGSWDDVSAAYNDGFRFWLNPAMTSVEGVLGTGEKDVYLVRPPWVSKGKVRVQSLSTTGSSISPAICLASPGQTPALPTRCDPSHQEVALPYTNVQLDPYDPDVDRYDVLIVVFNASPYDRSHKGDSVPYRLELVD